MNILIKPVDVLFFRDSKPFSRGSEHFTRSIFPPLPQTLYGALRTKAMETLGCDYMEFAKGRLILNNNELVEKSGGMGVHEKELGTVYEQGTFKLKGPFLLKDDTIYMKLPADVKKVNEEYLILSPFSLEEIGITSDLDILENYPHIQTQFPVEDVEGYLSLSEFTRYLMGEKIQKNEAIKSSEIYDYELRTGIGVNSDTNITGEGLLYTIGFIRLNNGWSFYASAENLSALPSAGLIKFGGDNRVCEYEKTTEDPFKYYTSKIGEIKKIVKNKKRFKLVLLTPAEFNEGWMPGGFNENLELNFNGIKIKLITASVGRPENISGWDMAQKKAKPLRKLVPAGSVYYFEIIEGEVEKIFDTLNFKSLSDKNIHSGFGLTLIGGW